MKKIMGILLLGSCMGLYAMQDTPHASTHRCSRITEIFGSDKYAFTVRLAYVRACEGKPEMTNELHQFFAMLHKRSDENFKVTLLRDMGVWFIYHTHLMHVDNVEEGLFAAGFRRLNTSKFYTVFFKKLGDEARQARASAIATEDVSERSNDDAEVKPETAKGSA